MLPTYETSIITAVKRVKQNLPFVSYVIGGRNETDFALFKKSNEYSFNLWRSRVFQVGKKFKVMKISIPILPDIAADMEIIPVLYFDNEDKHSEGLAINLANYPVTESGDGQRLIYLTPKDFTDSDNGNTDNVTGSNNFFLELQFTGEALAVVGLPINIEVDTIEN